MKTTCSTMTKKKPFCKFFANFPDNEVHGNSKTQTDIFSGIRLGKILAFKPVFRHVEPHLWLNEGDSQSPQ